MEKLKIIRRISNSQKTEDGRQKTVESSQKTEDEIQWKVECRIFRIRAARCGRPIPFFLFNFVKPQSLKRRREKFCLAGRARRKKS
jgi:hypothetical protein